MDTNIENKNIWMSQEQIAKLYDTTKNNISIHMKNIFECGELEENSVVKKFLTTASDNKKYKEGIIKTINKKDVDKIIICTDGLYSKIGLPNDKSYFEQDILEEKILNKNNNDDLTYILIGAKE